MRIGNESCIVFKYNQNWTIPVAKLQQNSTCAWLLQVRHPWKYCSTFSVLPGPITEETSMQREERWGGGFKHTDFFLYEFMRLVRNVLYRTAIQGYRVCPNSMGRKKSMKKRLSTHYVGGDNLFHPCWTVPIVRVLPISWSYKLMSQNGNISQRKKGE